MGYMETMNALRPTKWIISDDGKTSVFYTAPHIPMLFDDSGDAERYLNEFLTKCKGADRDDYEVICF